MPVYVDDMWTRAMGQYRRMKMSHMWSPDLDELHAMADKIGLNRKWFQDKSSFLHYDVSLSLRGKAVSFVAVEITMKELAQMVRDHKLQLIARMREQS